MLISRDEILKELEREHGIKITVRTFDYYRQKGLVPPIQSREKRKGLYPNYTPELLKIIKEMQKDGNKLSEIKEFCEVFINNKKMDAELEELRKKDKHLKSWTNPEIRAERIISFLNIEKKDNRCDSYISEEFHGKGIVFFTYFNSDYIDFYKLIVGLYQLEDIQLVEKKRLTHGEYMAIVKALVKPITENNRVMSQGDIFVAVFA